MTEDSLSGFTIEFSSLKTNYIFTVYQTPSGSYKDLKKRNEKVKLL